MKKFSPGLGLLVVALLATATGCSAQPKFSNDFKPWRIGVTTPSYYPVMVDRAYGVGVDDRIHPIQSFSFWTLTRAELDYVRRRLPDYDGWGLPLANPVMESQIGYNRILPASININWTSLIDRKLYVTKFKLSPEIKRKMSERQRFMIGNREYPCYQNSVVFGLLPGGDAKVFISGCRKYTLVGRVKPVETFDKYPVDDGWITDAEQTAIDDNVTLSPVPWDKVDKVWRQDQSS